MLTDHWIIAQLLAETCAFVLLTVAVVRAQFIMRYWNPTIANERQLGLERSSYLVSLLVQVVLFFSMTSLVLFLITVNHHLPPVIEGAMCATGTLAANDYGYALLYVKVFAVFVYAMFLILNKLDSRSPTSPLTPRKYFWVFPSWFFSLASLVLLYLYFANLSPDLITTCCAVKSFSTGGGSQAIETDISYQIRAIIVFVNSFFLLFFWLLFLKKRLFPQLILAIIYIISAIYALKYFFVKYIYGLPSHDCLFDLFFARYYGVGYLLFVSYYGLLLALLYGWLLRIYASVLGIESKALAARYWAVFFLVVSFVVPVAYWFFWEGNL